MIPSAKHTYRVGAIEVIPLWDGLMQTTLDKIPDSAHRAEAEELVAKAPGNALTMNVYGFMVKSGEEVALIDTGGGRFYAGLGELPKALHSLRMTPESVKHIFLTHLHRDHYGGIVNDKGQAAFPKAELIIHEKEASFWLDTIPEDMPLRTRANLESIRPCLAPYLGRIRRVADNEGTMGVFAHLAPGHSPGHTCWAVCSNGSMLLAWGDVIHIAEIHLPAPHIAFEYDLDPLIANRSRLRVLDWVAKDHILVAGAHLPASGIGTIVGNGNRYSFHPQ